MAAQWHMLEAPHMIKTYLLLSIGPSRDLDDHVQHRLLLIGIQRDIVEGRDRHAILLNVHPVLEGMWCSHLPRCELVRGLAVVAATGGQCR